MQIIDGYCNEPNIFADDIGEYNTAIWGTRDCVLPAGERLGYELISNNEIKIKDGVFSTQGRRGVIKKGTTESCIIENGTQAENRNDLIVIEYAKDSSTLVESHTLKVIKGTPGETATDPDVVTGDIQAGDVLHQMPLYRVKLEGLNVVAVERLFSVGNNAIGKEFDPDKDYEIGDLTLQYNKAWKFKVKHLAGAWDESQMEETDVLTELAEQNKNFGALTENLTWKKVGEVTGTASLALPSAFSELLVTVGSTIFYIPSILLDDTEKSYYYGKVASNGHYLSLGNNTVFVSKTNIRMTSINVENTSSVAIGSYKNITSSTTMTVYYR